MRRRELEGTPKPPFYLGPAGRLVFLAGVLISGALVAAQLPWKDGAGGSSALRLAGLFALYCVLTYLPALVLCGRLRGGSRLPYIWFYMVLALLTSVQADVYLLYRQPHGRDFIAELSQTEKLGYLRLTEGGGSPTIQHAIAMSVVNEFMDELRQKSSLIDISIDRVGSLPDLAPNNPELSASYIDATKQSIQALEQQIALVAGWEDHLGQIADVSGRPDLEFRPEMVQFKTYFGQNQPTLLTYYTTMRNSCMIYLNTLLLLDANSGHWHLNGTGDRVLDDPDAQQRYDALTASSQVVNGNLAKLQPLVLKFLQKDPAKVILPQN